MLLSDNKSDIMRKHILLCREKFSCDKGSNFCYVEIMRKKSYVVIMRKQERKIIIIHGLLGLLYSTEMTLENILVY